MIITSNLSVVSATLNPHTGEMICRINPTSPLYIDELIIESTVNLGGPVGLLVPGTSARPARRTIFADRTDPVFTAAAPFTLAVTYDAGFHLTAIQLTAVPATVAAVSGWGQGQEAEVERFDRQSHTDEWAFGAMPQQPQPGGALPLPRPVVAPPGGPPPSALPFGGPPQGAHGFGGPPQAPQGVPGFGGPPPSALPFGGPPPGTLLPAAPPPDAQVVGSGGKDAVDCTLFCPPTPMRGDQFLVQVFAHRPEQQTEAQAQAEEADGATVRRGHKRLRLPVAIGTLLQIGLRAPSLQLESATEELVWTGQPEAVQFVVRVPAQHPQGTAILTVTIGIDGIPLGSIRGSIKVLSEPTGDESRRVPSALGDEAVRYEKAFTSYASADRAEVLRRVQAVRAVGLKCFQDVIDLEPGERWQQALYRHIDECDLFLLFGPRTRETLSG